VQHLVFQRNRAKPEAAVHYRSELQPGLATRTESGECVRYLPTQ
jgi:hypothetical protein